MSFYVGFNTRHFGTETALGPILRKKFTMQHFCYIILGKFIYS